MRPDRPAHLLAILSAALLTSAITLPPRYAEAGCGAMVTDVRESVHTVLLNDATQVVLARDGEQTVLSMQNSYRGPVKHFAMVFPVPQILTQEDVSIIEPELFTTIDAYTAPRLVAYQERDPCVDERRDWDQLGDPLRTATLLSNTNPKTAQSDNAASVQIRESFDVGAYEVVVLSATEATALDVWLRDNGYAVPEGTRSTLQAYVQQGMYFIAVKVDPEKVEFRDGAAVLAPLQLRYSSPTFALPIRLGLHNSPGHQELIVTILSPDSRYEAANYDNAFIPTNLEVSEDVDGKFGGFYTKLFEMGAARQPGTVFTEYAWDVDLKEFGGNCDPCVGVMARMLHIALPALGFARRRGVVTRLHMRYQSDTITDDLVLRKAAPIVGGVAEGHSTGQSRRVVPGAANRFQGRYVMRIPWRGPVDCARPHYGQWAPVFPGWSGPNLALGPNQSSRNAHEEAPLTVPLSSLIREDVPALSLRTDNPLPVRAQGGCSVAGAGTIPGSALVVFALGGLIGWRRRDRT